jgi:hypothetical protein
LTFPGTDRIILIKEAAFIESVIHDLDVFRLSHYGSVTYVSERFVDRVRTGELLGLDFEKVWSSGS